MPTTIQNKKLHQLLLPFRLIRRKKRRKIHIHREKSARDLQLEHTNTNTQARHSDNVSVSALFYAEHNVFLSSSSFRYIKSFLFLWYSLLSVKNCFNGGNASEKKWSNAGTKEVKIIKRPMWRLWLSRQVGSKVTYIYSHSNSQFV